MIKNLKLCFIVTRDIVDRGRDIDQVLSHYMTFVKPAFEEFCLPVCNLHICLNYFFFDIHSIYCQQFQTKKFADIIIPRGADNAGMISVFI